MELWDVYDINRQKTEQTAVRGEGLPEGGHHMVVHICVFNCKGEMLIQQRQPFKEGWSNLWDVSCGGSAVKGETSAIAAMRETREEIGLEINLSGVKPKLSISFDVGFDDWYVVYAEPDITKLKLQYEEVQAVKWAGREEILAMIDSGEFIPYSKSFIEFIFDFKDQYGAIQQRG